MTSTTPQDPDSSQIECHNDQELSACQSSKRSDDLHHSSTTSKKSEEKAYQIIIHKPKHEACHHPLQSTTFRDVATKPTTPPSDPSNTDDRCRHLEKNQYPSNASFDSVDLDDIFDADESLASLDEIEILHNSTYIRNEITDSFKLDSTKRVPKFRVLGDDGVETNDCGAEELTSSPCP
ncbi:hypothetical protein ACHAXS_004432 [Conticribra weissflogii]